MTMQSDNVNLDILLKVGLGVAYAKLLNSLQESNFFFSYTLYPSESGHSMWKDKKQGIIH